MIEQPIHIDLTLEHWHADAPVTMVKVDYAQGEVEPNEDNWARSDYACDCGERVSVLTTVKVSGPPGQESGG